MYGDILVPTDGSEAAGRAAQHGLRLARRFDATAHALYVVEPVRGRDYRADGLVEALQAEGREATEDVADRGEELGVRVETAVRTGSVHRTILEYADEQDVDLIVMGTHGRTGIERYLLGSITEKVVRLAEVPVLTVSTRRQNGGSRSSP